jgi:hypothetical protein
MSREQVDAIAQLLEFYRIMRVLQQRMSKERGRKLGELCKER